MPTLHRLNCVFWPTSQGDKHLQEAFINGEDIHAATARRIFGLAPEETVDGNIRRQAKAVNFGIVYGISDFGLAKNIGVSRKQAKQIIDTYFEQYPGVKQWSEDIIASAREKGYVETIAHRRRYLPDIKAKNLTKELAALGTYGDEFTNSGFSRRHYQDCND